MAQVTHTHTNDTKWHSERYSISFGMNSLLHRCPTGSGHRIAQVIRNIVNGTESHWWHGMMQRTQDHVNHKKYIRSYGKIIFSQTARITWNHTNDRICVNSTTSRDLHKLTQMTQNYINVLSYPQTQQNYVKDTGFFTNDTESYKWHKITQMTQMTQTVQNGTIDMIFYMIFYIILGRFICWTPGPVCDVLFWKFRVADRWR